MHPGLSCHGHYADYFLKHMAGFSLRFYLPLNIISTLIFNRKRLLEHPKQTGLRVTKSVLRSATFLSLYCANAFAMQCLARRTGMLKAWNVPLFMAGHRCLYLKMRVWDQYLLGLRY